MDAQTATFGARLIDALSENGGGISLDGPTVVCYTFFIYLLSGQPIALPGLDIRRAAERRTTE